ncbi:hypothetical protein NM688_g7406 [Phlebia brevispora]|uniref:Uncharacterized protein n=1 Tax=Phlebia brevispora TaxID=194682 RepID=A0ACC1S5H2_9APHY|nr:hypothetical protein NM688_g7406 [Phlebia brevispora]
MIIVNDSKKGPGVPDPSETPAGPSSSTLSGPPPTFEESVGDTAINLSDLSSNVFIPPGGEEPPPAFTPYDAQYFENSDGTIVSHDPHLNEDGEALYRFLLAHAQTPPKLFLYLHGDHTEHRTRQVQKTDANGRTRWHTETESYTVVDFDFYVDISRYIMPEPTHFTIPDNEPAYRGKMYQEVDVDEHSVISPADGPADIELGGEQRVRRKATRQEAKTVKAWDHERVVIYGWNFEALQTATLAAIQSTFYNGNVTVKFVRRATKIHVRADNWLSRILSHTWVKVILWILLIYPFIWLFKRFASEGGGKWEVCGGAYALKAYELMAADPSIVITDKGPARVLGTKEGEWFAQWEGTIKRAVSNRLQTRKPLGDVDIRVAPAINLLDGYSPQPDSY